MSINYDDVRAQLAGAGLILDKDLVCDARIQRWKTDSKGHEKNGWSRLREWTSKAGNVYIVGAFGTWQGTDDGYTKVELPRRDDKAGDKPALTAEDLAAMRAAQKAAAQKLDAERRAETKTAARWAASVWAACAPCTEHEYTTRKRIAPHGLRVLTADALQHSSAPGETGDATGRGGNAPSGAPNAAGRGNSLQDASIPTINPESTSRRNGEADDPRAGEPKSGNENGDAPGTAIPDPAALNAQRAGGGGLSLPGLDESNWFRLTKAVGALVVPMHDANANVCGIQFIYPKGHERAKKIERDKEFWPAGMAMGGTFGLIGHVNRSGFLLVAEGYATAASLHEATGQSVAYAFSANNLAKAAKQLRKVYPHLRLLFCADDDYLTAGNPGVTAAVNATAELERAAWVKPDFTLPADEAGVPAAAIDAGAPARAPTSTATPIDRRNGKKLTDFNDLLVLAGLPLLLANQVNAKLDALKWREPQLPRDSALQGAGAGASGGAGSGGAGLKERREALSVMPIDEVVARFVPIDDGTGKYVFDAWTNKVAHRDQMIALLPAGVRADDVKRNPRYIERGAYYLDQVGFDPSGADPNVKLNTWRGWPTVPKAGKCELLLDLLRYLCSEDPNADTIYHWILCWMAYPLQHPGAKLSSAIIMHGPQGTGKSTVFQQLAKIYGDYSTVLNQRGLEDKFNADWSDSKLLILAEEVVTRAEMWHIKNELKELVSGEWIRVNPKNIAAYRQRNQVNIVYLSNENQPLPLDNDDRRHLVVYTPPALADDYFDEIYAEIDAGGVAAFYQYLLDYDCTGFHPKKKPPMTEAKQALMALASPSEVRFITDWLAGDLNLPICPCLAGDLYQAYARWCRTNGESRPRPSNQFHGTIARLPGWEKKKHRVHQNFTYSGETVRKPIVIPPTQAIEAAGKAMAPGRAVAEWLTDCIYDFAGALHDGDPDPVRRAT